MAWTWTAQSREWQKQAAWYSSYHTELAQALLPYLDKDSRVAEFGCGLGFLSLALSPSLRHLEAYDLDQECINFLQMQAQQQEQTKHLRAHCLDVFQLTAKQEWDYVIACLFADVESVMTQLLCHSRKAFLYLVNTAPGRSIVPGPRKEGKMYADDVAKALHTRAFERKDLCFEFGQPFRTMEQARAFVRHYSVGTLSESEITAFLERSLREQADHTFYLPHAKHLSLFVLYAHA